MSPTENTATIADTVSDPLPTPEDVLETAARIRPYARRTPTIDLDLDGRRAVLKLEFLQHSGSFKFRGAVNALLTTDPDVHIVTASGGNHGLAVATAAEQLGRKATVFVPETAPVGKVRRLLACGAQLERHGSNFAEAAEAARTEAARPGHRFLHAYDESVVVTGQGTVALEVCTDRPDVDAVVVAVGGGGLAAGTVLGAGSATTVAVEPELCCAMHKALAAGRPVDTVPGSVASSATGASRAGALPFRILSAAPRRESLTVSDEQILAARDRLWEELRIAVEPAAALPFAVWLAGQVPGEFPCLVLCGANTDQAPL